MKKCKWKSFLSAFCSFAISNLDAHSVRQMARDFFLDVHILYGKKVLCFGGDSPASALNFRYSSGISKRWYMKFIWCSRLS